MSNSLNIENVNKINISKKENEINEEKCSLFNVILQMLLAFFMIILLTKSCFLVFDAVEEATNKMNVIILSNESEAIKSSLILYQDRKKQDPENIEELINKGYLKNTSNEMQYFWSIDSEYNIVSKNKIDEILCAMVNKQERKPLNPNFMSTCDINTGQFILKEK